MKTKTFSILFALVMILSMSVGVFAQDPSYFDETWDENTVLTVFSDMDLVFPDMFADEDSDFLWVDGPHAYPNELRKGDDDKFISKAPVEGQVDYWDEVEAATTLPGTFTYDPCGDGLIKFSVNVPRDNDFWQYQSTSVGADKYGPERVTFIRNIFAKVTITSNGISRSFEADVKKCNAPENCHLLAYNARGIAKLEGYLYVPAVLTNGVKIDVDMRVVTSNYMTALWEVPYHYVKVGGTASPNAKRDYCQNSLSTYAVPGVGSDSNLGGIRAKYDENTGEARFQVTLRNFAQEPNRRNGFKGEINYVIPADILIAPFFDADVAAIYTCTEPAPKTDVVQYWEDTVEMWKTLHGYTACTDPINGVVVCNKIDTATGNILQSVSINVNDYFESERYYREMVVNGTNVFTCTKTTDHSTSGTPAYDSFTCTAATTATLGYDDTTNPIYADRAEYLQQFGYSCAVNPNVVDVMEALNSKFDRYTDYTCKYTLYNNFNAAPRTDYCKFGEGIAVAPNAIIRIDITIDHLAGKVLRFYDGADIPFWFRVGGMTSFVTGGRYEAVDFPCPYISRMQVKNPLKPFMTFFEMDSDPAIKPTGAYGVYEGGLWGLYQKCGKYAYMAVRLKNDGTRSEFINLDRVAVAINGGTPMKWNWVLSTVEAWKGKIELEAGEEVILIGRAKVTDIPSQLNADTAMTGAVNFLDYGFYITGKVFSDHNNTRCVAAPK